MNASYGFQLQDVSLGGAQKSLNLYVEQIKRTYAFFKYNSSYIKGERAKIRAGYKQHGQIGPENVRIEKC